MGFELRRKLYARGSSYETTIPMPLLFKLNKKKKHDVVYRFDEVKNSWYVCLKKRSEKSSFKGFEFNRKLYSRGSSYEATIPVQLLFEIDTNKKYDVLFVYDVKKDRWYLSFNKRK